MNTPLPVHHYITTRPLRHPSPRKVHPFPRVRPDRRAEDLPFFPREFFPGFEVRTIPVLLGDGYLGDDGSDDGGFWSNFFSDANSQKMGAALANVAMGASNKNNIPGMTLPKTNASGMGTGMGSMSGMMPYLLMGGAALAAILLLKKK